MATAGEVYRLFTIVTEILMVYTLILSFYFNKKLSQTSLIHPNLKLILRNIAVVYPIINIARFVSYGWTFVMEAEIFAPYQANIICLIPRFIEEVGVGCCATLIVQITLERTVATLMRKTYEKKGAQIGWMITGQTLLTAFTFSTCPIIYDIFISERMDLNKAYVGCRLDQFHVFMYLMVFVSAFICSVASALVLLYIYCYCRYQLGKMEEMNLSTRYQYSENISCIKALLPSMGFYLFTATAGVYVTIFVYSNFYTYEEIERNRVLIDAHLMVLHIIGQLYAIGAMTCFLTFFKPLRNEVVNDINCLLRKKYVEPDEGMLKADVVKREENIDHFKMMNKSWQ
ncbi:unnamed protein product [Bursaphelenchus xylophilus]|uniref:(pine wood nematode) hypothetical protein n=1 Tax=Bursaphelenchus xylophilus TaxID=6326 RepID=A0A1I7SL10_BURXY|nr:unnamed protein product [Bursaphelenchus xylophilus]CAG9129327.1 unnamed protein product [Bursaphelenchus xylophilus]